MNENEVEAAVGSFLAEQRMKEAADYIRRGRCFKDATTEQLEAMWVENVRLWSEDPVGRVTDAKRNDICAEIMLRGANLPDEPVRAYFDTIRSVLTAGASRAEPEAWERLTDEISGAWGKEGARQN